MIEALQRPAIIGMAEHRPRREQLVERQRAMKDVAAEQAEIPLEIERRQNLAADHACREARRILSTVAIIRSATSSRWSSHDAPSGNCGATCWQNRLATCWPGGRKRVVERRGDQHLHHRLAAPAVRAGVVPGAVHVAEARADDDAGGEMIAGAGNAVKEGRADSATLIRNVPEPLRQRAMRSRNGGSAPAGSSRVYSNFGLTLATTYCARMVRRRRGRRPRRGRSRR